VATKDQILSGLGRTKTEFSYHFPQGTHLGHLLYIISVVGSENLEDTRLKSENIRFIGSYDQGKPGNFQRETKYKLQAAMEMGMLVDYRDHILDPEFKLQFTSEGRKLFRSLQPLISRLDLSFTAADSWRMGIESSINQKISDFLASRPASTRIVRQLWGNMDAVSLMADYLKSHNVSSISKSLIYRDFFSTKPVRAFLKKHGLKSPTTEVIKRRIPFLFNVLEALGEMSQGASEIQLLIYIGEATSNNG